MKLTSFLFKAARKSRDIEVLLSFDLLKIYKRFVLHKLIGKGLVKKLMQM